MACAVMSVGVTACDGEADESPEPRGADRPVLLWSIETDMVEHDTFARYQQVGDVGILGPILGDGPDSTFSAVDPSTGEELWSATSDPQDVWISGDRLTTRADDEVEVREAATGEVAFSVPIGKWGRTAVSNGVLITAWSDDDVMFIDAFEIATGEVSWSMELPDDGFAEVAAAARPNGVDGGEIRRHQRPPMLDSGVEHVFLFRGARENDIESVSTIDVFDGTLRVVDEGTPGEPMSVDGSNVVMRPWNLGYGGLDIDDDCRLTMPTVSEDHDAGELLPYLAEHRKGSWECGSYTMMPQITAEGVYGVSADFRPTLFDYSGRPIWSADERGTPVHVTAEVAAYSVPDGVDDDHHMIRMVDRRTGTVLWENNLTIGPGSWGNFTVNDGWTVYTSSEFGMAVLDTETGAHKLSNVKARPLGWNSTTLIVHKRISRDYYRIEAWGLSGA